MLAREGARSVFRGIWCFARSQAALILCCASSSQPGTVTAASLLLSCPGSSARGVTDASRQPQAGENQSGWAVPAGRSQPWVPLAKSRAGLWLLGALRCRRWGHSSVWGHGAAPPGLLAFLCHKDSWFLNAYWFSPEKVWGTLLIAAQPSRWREHAGSTGF